VRQHNGGSTSAVAGSLRALGAVFGHIFGQYGDASEDVYALLPNRRQGCCSLLSLPDARTAARRSVRHRAPACSTLRVAASSCVKVGRGPRDGSAPPYPSPSHRCPPRPSPVLGSGSGSGPGRLCMPLRGMSARNRLVPRVCTSRRRRWLPQPIGGLPPLVPSLGIFLCCCVSRK
jgi:hypothetical protein